MKVMVNAIGRIAPLRRYYLRRIERFIRMRCGVEDCDLRWDYVHWRRKTDLFLFLYGLPAEIQIALALKAVMRYLPLFEAQNPGATIGRRLVEATEKWLTNPAEGEALLKRYMVTDVRLWEHHGWFVQEALYNLRYLVLRWRKNKLATAAGTAQIITACIQQRMTDVWRIDDPEGYHACRRMHEIEVGWSLGGEGLSAEEQEQLDEEWQSLDERWRFAMEKNVAACAVGRREWSILLGWLSDIERQYPEAEAPSRREMTRWVNDTWWFGFKVV